VAIIVGGRAKKSGEMADHVSTDDFPSVPSRLATLLTLFRSALPELHSYFEDEQVPFLEVAVCWLRTLLAREMWLGDVLRLWGESASRASLRGTTHLGCALTSRCLSGL
jgi:hypothetical protein